MAKKKEEDMMTVTHKDWTVGPFPASTLDKAEKNLIEQMDETIEDHKKWEKKVMKKAIEHDASKSGMDLLDSLNSKKEEINGHLHRIIDHAISNPDEKPGKVTLQITTVPVKGSVIVVAKIKSVIPNEIDGAFQIAKISRDDGQLTLFD